MGRSKKQWDDEQQFDPYAQQQMEDEESQWYNSMQEPAEFGPAMQRGYYALQAAHWQAEAAYYASCGDEVKEDACYVWVAFYATLDRRLPERTEEKALLEQFNMFGLEKRELVTVGRR